MKTIISALAALALFAGGAGAQTAATMIPGTDAPFLDTSSGAALPCVGCTLSSFAAGTNTPLRTYVDTSGTTQNAVIITLNSAGYSPSGIFIKSSCYKFVLKSAQGVVLRTQDNICDNVAFLAQVLANAAAINPFVVTAGYASFALACAGAVSASKSLAISTTIAVVAGTYTCPLIFFGGGLLTTTAGAAHMQGTISAPMQQQIFNTTGGGTVVIDNPAGSVSSVKWYGAKGDSIAYTSGTDDTAAIQATFDGVGPLPGSFGAAPKTTRTVFFPDGRYKLSAAVVIPSRQIVVTAASVPAGNSAAYLWQTNKDADILDYCTSPSDSVSVTNLGFDGPSATHVAGTGSAICLGSSGEGVFDSTIQNNYFHQLPFAGIKAVNAEGYLIFGNVFELADYGLYVPQDPTNQFDNFRILGNWFYGHHKAALFITHGIDNAVRDNQFYLNGAIGVGGAITLDTTPASGADREMRSTAITANSFHQNLWDVIATSATLGSNEGVIGVNIATNTSDFGQYGFLLATNVGEIQAVGNKVKFGSLIADGTIPAFDLEGTSADAFLDANTVVLNGGLGNSYGIKTGASTTNTVVGLNRLAGTVAPASMGGTWQVGTTAATTAHTGGTYDGSLTETGTFVPVLAFGGSSTGITYDLSPPNGQVGVYARTGNQITITISLVLTSKGSATGVATISGLPYAASSASTVVRYSTPIGFFGGAWVGLVAPSVNLTPGATVLAFQDVSPTGATGITNANFTNTSGLDVTLTYTLN